MKRRSAGIIGIHKTMFLLIALWFIAGENTKLSAQVIRAFTQRAAAATPTKLIYNIRGDYTMIGNTNLTLDVYGDNTNNSNNYMHYVDVDADPNTLNSSAATLTFSTENGAVPSCSRILYAGLYWTGRASNSTTSPESFTVTKGSVTKNYNKRTISLKGPGQSSYTQFVANPGNIYYPTTGEGFMYSAYIEVTDYVKANGLGEYTAADIALIEGNGGSTGYYGGWGMIVVYENSKMNWRDVTIFDGHAYVTGNATLSFDLPVSGFHTAQSGPVNLKLGLMAGEGDVGISGDYFRIRNYQDNAWVTLNHSGNSAANFFNGSVNTGGNARNPNLQNNTGLDIASFYIPNAGNSVITNNQTSTKFQYGSTQDTYIIFCIAMAVDAYVPDVAMFVSAQSINGQPVGSGPLTVQPGQDIEYKLEVKNLGTEAVNNVKFVVPIPYTTTYVNGTAGTTINFLPLPTPNNFYFDPTLGLTGSVVWDFGTLPLPPVGYPDSVLAELTFHFKVTDDCHILKNPDCPPNVTLSGGVISGVGAISGASFGNVPIIQGYQTSGGCIGEPITDPLQISIDAAAYIAQYCQNVSANNAFVFCNYTAPTIPVDSIAPHFPLGLKFYNTNNVTPSSIEYDANNPFPATPGTHTYFAIPVGINFCYYTFTIHVSNITSVPLTSDLIYCLNDAALPLTAVTTDPSYTLFFYNTINSTSPQYTVTPSTSVPGVVTWYVAEGDSGTCISPNRDSIKVTVYDLINASINSSAQTNVLCKGGNTGSATAIASGSNGNFSYSWSTAPVQTTATATGLAAGSYTVTVSTNIGCSSPSTAVATITEPSVVLGAAVSVLANVSCKGDNTGFASVTASGGSLSYAYVWSTVPAQTTANATGLSAGNYSVTVSDNNGCTISVSATASVSEPVAGLASSLAAFSYNGQNISCNGANDGSIDLNVNGGTSSYTYNWSNSATTEDISGLSAGNYSVLITDANGCTTTNTITLTEPSILSSAIISVSNYNGQNISCNGLSNGSIDLTANGGTGTYTYSWSNSASTQDISGLSAGNYSVVVNDANGCLSSASVSLTEPATLASTATVTSNYNGQQISCFGMNDGSVDLSVSGGIMNYTYSWSNGAVTQDISGIAAGNYSVVITDVNGCTSIASVILMEPSQLGLAAAITNVTCNGYSNGAVDITPGGGTPAYTYSWNNGATTQDLSGIAAGKYIVTITDANGCSAQLSNSVYEDQKLDVAITFLDVSCNGLSDGEMSILVNGGVAPYQYAWSNGATTQWVTGLPAGTYYVSITDSNSCVIKDTMVITEPNVLSATFDPSVYSQGYNISWFNANDGSINLTVSGGTAPYNYFWSAGSTNEDISNLPAGNYTVQVTDANGCILLASVELTGPFALEMPTGYSPNSDGKNDYFVVHGIEMYPDNEILVFNRWGNIVYKRSNYLNEWNGQGVNGDSLPDATYFVILKIASHDIVLQGYVDLRR